MTQLSDLRIGDFVRVPHLDSDAVDGVAIGEVVALHPWNKLTGVPDEADRVRVAFENTTVLCFANCVEKIVSGSTG